MGHHKAEYDRRVQLLQRASWARRAVEEHGLDPLTAIYLVVCPTTRMLELQADAKGMSTAGSEGWTARATAPERKDGRITFKTAREMAKKSQQARRENAARRRREKAVRLELQAAAKGTA